MSLFKGIASQPVTFDIDIPTAIVGAVLDSGWWEPVLGGNISESGQVYTAQRGAWIKVKQAGKPFSLVNVWGSGQFSVKGTIVGTLQLKGLPFPTGNVPCFMSGVCGYYSNLSPEMALNPIVMPWTSGNRLDVNLYAPVQGSNPRPLSVADINDHTQFMFSFAYPCSEPVIQA